MVEARLTINHPAIHACFPVESSPQAAMLYTARALDRALRGSQPINEVDDACLAIARCQLLKAEAVLLAEAIADRAVNIENAKNPAILPQRNDQFGPRCGVAGYVTGKGVHIRNNNRLLLRHRHATDAFSNANADTGGLALKGPQNQFGACCEKIEPHPVEFIDELKDQG